VGEGVMNEVLNVQVQGALIEACQGLVQLGLLPAELAPEEDAEQVDAEAIYSALRERAAARIACFDAECISDDGDYAELLKTLAHSAGIEGRISDIRSSYAHEHSKATISCVVDGEPFARDWKQHDDYVTADFVSFVRETFAEKLDVHTAPLPRQDQCVELLFLSGDASRETADALRRAAGEVDPDTVTGQRIIVTLFLCFVGFIVTTGVGAFVFGFWVSLGASALFWTVVGLWRGVKLVQQQTAEEELQQLAKDDPAAAGRLIQEELRNQFPKEWAAGTAAAERLIEKSKGE
jgi:hypothetical protein